MAKRRNFVITITTAGTAVPGSGSAVPGNYMIQAYKGNTGDYIYFGNDGQDNIETSTGWAVKKDGAPMTLYIERLSDLYFDADTSGDKAICLLLD